MRSNLRCDPLIPSSSNSSKEHSRVLGVKVNPTLSNELDSDEELEASLRRELIEIALVA
jgi:hypothetical protein